MSCFTEIQLNEAKRSICSTLSKCEKAIDKLKEGSAQFTLTMRRIEAFKIAVTLIDKELDAK